MGLLIYKTSLYRCYQLTLKLPQETFLAGGGNAIEHYTGIETDKHKHYKDL